MKNWIIKKLGGWTNEEHNLTIQIYQKNIAQLKKQEAEAVEDYLTQYELRKLTQAELEKLKNWRNNVAKTMRQNKIPRHIINKIMNLRNQQTNN